MFDREMVVVQQAAEDDGYTYDSSWLPWSNDTAKFPLLADQQAAEDNTGHREACPGLLLFRKGLSDIQPDGMKRGASYDEALVVLVVGEQPTAGVNGDQWANAIHWLSLNASLAPLALGGAAPPTRDLRIFGPTFSGSLVSLDRSLTGLYRPPPDGPSGDLDAIHLRARFPTVSILSGSVSSCSAVHWFQGRLEREHLAPAIQFGSFQENDELHIYRFFSYIKQLGSDTRDTAVLSEDETAYANSYHPANEPQYEAETAKAAKRERTLEHTAAPACDFVYAEDNRPLRLSYPRDISALRTAYEKQAVFSSSGGGHTTHAILQDTAEQGSESPETSDSIKAFAGPMSPVAQEAVLYGIVSYLRAHTPAISCCAAPTPLDFLFLTRFFHRAYPEGRIVTVGSDLLYARDRHHRVPRRPQPSPATRSFPSTSTGLISPKTPAPRPPMSIVSSSPTWRVATSPGATSSAAHLPPPPSPSYNTVSFPWLENLPDYADTFWLHKPRRDHPAHRVSHLASPSSAATATGRSPS